MNFAPMVVNLLAFKVNVLDRASQLSFGPSLQVDTFLSTKRNMGFGEDNGDFSPIYFPLNIILDQDLIESNAIKTSAI
ncbi:hypothetical protein ACFFK0_25470 [Paenibacillus chartarius]|uniref:Uncharacterized protein n=1 Tax=Paenibacillus chartarius TaxID=747481 RepID=A0ABV6DSX2_9BACL